MFKKLIILLFVFICLFSGAFAVLSNQPLEKSTDDMNASTNIVNDILSSSFNNKGDFNDYFQETYGNIVNINGELRHYINEFGGYYLESEGLADRYIYCIECRGFIPIGPIINPLPKEAICHHNSISGFSLGYKDYSISRDEAYAEWVERGRPVYDEEHFKPINPITFIKTIHCLDCGGSVILTNFTDLLYNYFNVYNMDIDLLSMPNILCNHYNSSLDVFNTPAEDFYPGWFGSVEEYNAWLHDFSLKNNTTEKVYVPWGEHEDPVKINPVNLSENYSNEADFNIPDDESEDFVIYDDALAQ